MSDRLLQHQFSLPFGATLQAGGTYFRLWAPKHQTVQLHLDHEHQPLSLVPVGDGWHDLFVPGVAENALYRFRLPDGSFIPDPASRFQPSDVQGPSQVIDPKSYRWQNLRWQGRPWEEAILYELHVGTFTPGGTFQAAIQKLDHLADLGITAIELMPIADFPGGQNWGYDGVLLFAPDSTYGRPEDLKAFIDAAHSRGIMVILDVVYNHFGPEGNYLPAYAPIFTEKHQTPWGAAVNYDAEQSAHVREFIIANALFWIHEYRFDGLRLDAVHAIMDDSPQHILSELATRVRDGVGDRHVHLILENEENEAGRLVRRAARNPGEYTAQWNDDFHHVLHTAMTGERSGYYAEFEGDTEKLGRAIAEGFAFQGEVMEYKGGARGQPSSHLPPTAFVSFIQNHDQVGNRAFGDRITSTASVAAVRAAAALYLLAPQIPMLFMGEEWAANQPFLFFCDFGGDLANAVSEGRRNEFAKFPEFHDPERRDRIPDPTSRETFLSSKLRWEDAESGAHAEWRDWYRSVLAVRHREIIPLLWLIGGNSARYEILGEGAVRVGWTLDCGSELLVAANLRAEPLAGIEHPRGRVLWSEGFSEESGFGPWSVVWMVVEEKT